MTNSEFIEESDVTSENLEALFIRSFYKAYVDDDDDVIVRSEGATVIVSVNENNSLLVLRSVFSFRENIELELKYQLANRMNDDYIYVRYSVHELSQDRLVADYFLPFEGGVLAYQIIAALRLFVRIAPLAVREYDSQDIVQ